MTEEETMRTECGSGRVGGRGANCIGVFQLETVQKYRYRGSRLHSDIATFAIIRGGQEHVLQL